MINFKIIIIKRIYYQYVVNTISLYSVGNVIIQCTQCHYTLNGNLICSVCEGMYKLREHTMGTGIDPGTKLQDAVCRVADV